MSSYHKADITTGNINDINVTYIIWKQDKLTFYEDSCLVTLFTTFTHFLDQTALLLGFFFEYRKHFTSYLQLLTLF